MDLEDEYRRAADAIASADAVLIGAGAGMGVDPACLTSGDRKDSGRLTHLFEVVISAKCRPHIGFVQTRNLPGASLDIATISIDRRSPIPVFKFCRNGRSSVPMAASSSPAMSMASSRNPGSHLMTSLSATGRFTICNVQHRVIKASGRRVTRFLRLIWKPSGRHHPCRNARSVARSPAPIF